MQLVAYGAQDIYLTGNPMITYFKVVYRRHTNFAMESIEQTFNGTPTFGSKVTALISRNGDLVNGMLLEATVPDSGADTWVSNVGHYLIDQVDVEIGGQCIDRHYGDWLEIWSQLSIPASQKINTDSTALSGGYYEMVNGNDSKVYVPLQFWFCRNVGLALPLIALQYHEVKVSVTFAQRAALITDTTVAADNTGDLSTVSLWVDYIYLDTDERRRFAQVSHEYLIEQLQFTGDETIKNGENSVTLNFNHPVKELVWVLRDAPNGADSNNGPAGIASDLVSAKLQLNGHDRFASRDGAYFRLVQTACHTCKPTSAIYVYSFALKPEDHQPSGTCNFSRIDNAKLKLDTTGGGATIARVFATNYNVLRVMSGMGGLAYSN